MPLPRGLSLEEQPHVPEIPVGLPSVLLEARPDIRAPEEALVAENADVGVAKAALFPQIALTGTGGVSSPSLAKLFSGHSRYVQSAAAPCSHCLRVDAFVTVTSWRKSNGTLRSSPTRRRYNMRWVMRASLNVGWRLTRGRSRRSRR